MQRTYCEVENPNQPGHRWCIWGAGHKSLNHRDQDGFEWSDPEQVSGNRAHAHEVLELRKLIADLVRGQTDPCRYDHDGDCQEHGWFDCNYECPIAVGREKVADLL